VARVKVPEGGLVLDLCTGTGAVVLAFAKARKEGSLVVGLDFSRGMLRRAKPKALSLGLLDRF
jgi:demethylmenaquinone methyltransferase/2-methoxy-6-polyprenyl-1,4-benzoquinol methylase